MEVWWALLPAAPFRSPSCGAVYKLVRARAEPNNKERKIICLCCCGPLTAREDAFVSKYFSWINPSQAMTAEPSVV
jgi:hypothetical protein